MSHFPLRPEPFVQRTDPAAIEDLRRRLRATRWPDAPDAGDDEDGWAQGADVGYLRELVAYWADGFDWEEQEARLNELPRFRAIVAAEQGGAGGGSAGAAGDAGRGVGIHYVHARGKSSGGHPLPLVLAHGWPDSFWRYTKVIDLLTDPAAHGGDPADAFDVVVPDMPGFGYSDRPARALDSREVAALWAELMTGLGYERFGAAGGDIGSHVSRYLALDAAERVVAVHRTDAGLPSPSMDPAELTPAERDWLAGAAAWGASEGAYAAMHRTKPQTAAVGLTDSPAGLAAWIVEKLRAWSDLRPSGELERVYSRDEILTNLSIYWFTGTIASSMRMYRANAALPVQQLMRRVEVPSGFAIFPGDIVRPPREWLERTANTVRVAEPVRGGHFAPFEQPELYARELRDFFRPYRTEAL